LREFLRQKYLLAALFVAILTLLPSVASAQRVIPHAFLGLATVNGNPASDGTVVAAFVDGRQVVAESVSGGSYPVLMVEPDADSFVGKTVTFTIGGIPANEIALWTQGQVTQLNLTASPTQATPVPQATTAATATPVLVVGERGDAGPSGPSGPSGPQGSQGVQGPSGPPGVGGPPGSAGAAGPAGVPGPTGSQGLTGAEGGPGSEGSSLFGILAFVFALFAFLGTFGGALWRRLVE